MSKLIDCARAEDHGRLADEWLEALASDPPLNEMADALEVLVESGAGDTARELLELTIEAVDNEDDPLFREFLKRAAVRFSECEPLRKALVELARDEHLVFQPLERFLSLSGMKAPGGDVAASWKAFLSLMMYRDGGYLLHGSFGTGRIRRVSRDRMTADFRGRPEQGMTLDVAFETTLPLDPSSLAVTALERPSVILEMLERDPSGFLERLFLEPFTDPSGVSPEDLAPLSSDPEMEIALIWDPLCRAASGSSDYFLIGNRIVRLESSKGPSETLRQIISRRGVPVSSMIPQVRTLLKAVPADEPLQTDELLREAAALGTPETGALFELAWLLSDHGALEGSQDTLANLVEHSAPRAERAISEIASQTCRRAYLDLFLAGDASAKEKVSLISSLRRPDWEHAVASLESRDPELLAECTSVYLSDPSRTDLFLWTLTFMAERGKDLPESRGVQLLLDNLAFASSDTRNRVVRLLTGPLRERLEEFLASIDSRRLQRYLELFDSIATAHNEGLYLTAARELSSRKGPRGGSIAEKRPFWETDRVFSSRGAINRRQQEITRLERIEIPAAAEAVGEAASHGDLSENAEYTAAIEKRDLLLARLSEWSEELRKYRPYPVDEIPTETVSPGVRVVIRDTGDRGKTRTLDIVGPLDADPERGRINYRAPLGKALLGRSKGDTVKLPGPSKRMWKVVSIEMLPPEEL